MLLDVYRRLAALRRSLPALTDPAFPSMSATADEATRVFTLRRSDLLIAVNFSDIPVTLTDSGDLMFSTPTSATVGPDGLHLAPHAGVLLRLSTH